MKKRSSRKPAEKKWTVIGLYTDPYQAFAHHVTAPDWEGAVASAEDEMLGADHEIVGVVAGHLEVYGGPDES